MCVQAYKCKSIYLTETKPAFFWSGLKSELVGMSHLTYIFFVLWNSGVASQGTQSYRVM